MQYPFKWQAGFSLLELMIVVAIIGILSAIAYPSYQSHVMNSRRSAAQLCLLEMAAKMEHRYAANLFYAKPDTDKPNSVSGLQHVTGASCSKESDLDSFYRFEFEGKVTAKSFLLRAKPIGPQAEDRCGIQKVDQTGTKSVDKALLSDWECW